MLRSPDEDRRISVRKRMLKGGVIAFSARHATLPCVVRDLSDTGARLQVKATSSVPDTFDLIVELDGLEAPSRVVWRSLTELGVRFVSEPTKVAPKRSQVVDVAVPTLFRAKATLRRPPAPAQAAPVAPTASRGTLTPQQQPVGQARPADGMDTRPAAGAPTDREAVVATPPAAKLSVVTVPIVIADDDPDDQLLIQDAFHHSNFKHPFKFVDNGEELLKYLKGQAPYQDRQRPGLVLLDLNMPRMDGRTALMHIRTDAALRSLPVIVMTTSNADEDIQRTYELGVSAYIPKPNSLDGLLELVEALDKYWMRMVSLPYRAQA